MSTSGISDLSAKTGALNSQCAARSAGNPSITSAVAKNILHGALEQKSSQLLTEGGTVRSSVGSHTCTGPGVQPVDLVTNHCSKESTPASDASRDCECHRSSAPGRESESKEGAHVPLCTNPAAPHLPVSENENEVDARLPHCEAETESGVVADDEGDWVTPSLRNAGKRRSATNKKPPATKSGERKTGGLSAAFASKISVGENHEDTFQFDEELDESEKFSVKERPSLLKRCSLCF